MRRAWLIWLAVCLLLVSCQSVQVVDEQGAPVKDALVMYWEPQFYFQRHYVGSALTNEEGIAEDLSIPSGAKVIVLKPGYHPVWSEDFNYQDRSFPRESCNPDQCEFFKLYPIESPGKPVLRNASLRWGATDSTWQEVKHELGLPIKIEARFARLFERDSRYRVSAVNGKLYPAKQFFWDTDTQLKNPQNSLELQNGDSFFVMEESEKKLSKVRLSHEDLLIQTKGNITQENLNFLICELGETPIPIESPLFPGPDWNIGEPKFSLPLNLLTEIQNAWIYRGPLAADRAAEILFAYINSNQPYVNKATLKGIQATLGTTSVKE